MKNGFGPKEQRKLSLTGSVALGRGVMIGAGIFALIGQAAELAGGWVPGAFFAGAVVVGVSSYSYIRYAATSPASGAIARLLKAAYGPGVVSLLPSASILVQEAVSTESG